MYKSHTGTDELQNRIFAYLRDAHAVNGTNVAFVNLQTYVLCPTFDSAPAQLLQPYPQPYRLFGAINATASAFGYTGNGTSTCLLSADTTEGGCDDPDTEVFYIRESILIRSRVSGDADPWAFFMCSGTSVVHDT